MSKIERAKGFQIKVEREEIARCLGYGDNQIPPRVLTAIKEIEEITVKYEGTTIWVALSYGGRAEILAAVNEAVKQGESVDEDSFKSLMWSAEMPDPDLIVRTGGDNRLSNFLTWQSVYSELVFIEKFWPELTGDDLDVLLVEFYKSRRTFG